LKILAILLTYCPPQKDWNTKNDFGEVKMKNYQILAASYLAP
jgi:hypothetical protein